MKKLLYYYRHGETYYTANKLSYGNKELEALLTEKGRSQVNLLGAELAKRGPFDLHYTSPLPRAVQSATIVQTYLDSELLIDPALSEETAGRREDTWQRVEKLLERVLKLPQERILLSTHGMICCMIAAYFRGQTWRNMNLENLPTAGFGWLEIEDGEAKRGCRSSSIHLISGTKDVAENLATSVACSI